MTDVKVLADCTMSFRFEVIEVNKKNMEDVETNNRGVRRGRKKVKRKRREEEGKGREGDGGGRERERDMKEGWEGGRQTRTRTTHQK